MATIFAQNMIGTDIDVGTALVASSDFRTAAQVTAGSQPYRSGTVVWGNDGRKYVYGKTAGAIGINARCDYVPSTKLITAAVAGALINLNLRTGGVESGGSAWFAAVQNYLAGAGIGADGAPPG
jgi:hypothetical protein